MDGIALESCSVTYRAGSSQHRTTEGDGNVELACTCDGEVVTVRARARRDLVLEDCVLRFSHRFELNEQVLLNGYQSWTDTVERSPFERMRGLRGTPRPVVDKYVLDGGGDYRFREYSLVRGRMHGYTYATFRQERGRGARSASIVLMGSLDESNGFTLIETDVLAREVAVHKECAGLRLAAGEACVLCRLAVIEAEEPERAYEHWFDLMGIQALPVRPLIGYTSWYRHYDAITAEELELDLAGAASALELLGLDGIPGRWEAGGVPAVSSTASAATPDSRSDLYDRLGRLFQIDDGYAVVGDWLEVDADKFPQGLVPLARSIENAGFVAGLWVAPFVCSRNSVLAREHPDWLLIDEKDGSPVTTGSHWGGALALDTLNPCVRAYVVDVLRTMTTEWGFRLLKCDFLYAACMLAHGGLNRGQLMADGIDLIRSAIGPDVAILACGVPLGSVFGKVEYCRIGCDVGLDWDDKPYMRLLHRERVSTKMSLANTRGRAPLNGRAFANDPDVFFLREDVRLTDAQRDDLLRTDARLGSVLLTSDDMGAWGPAQREAYRAAVQALAKASDRR